MNHCLANIPHFFVLGLPENPPPHVVYFVLTDGGMLMYVTDASGTPYLVSGSGGGGSITLTSPNGTIAISGYNIDIAQSVLDGIISLHNEFPDLQGGILNEYFHLSQAEHTYLTDVVANDSIGDLQDAINMLATPPTYTPPTASITNVTGTYEVGSSQLIDITQTFNQNNAGAKISETITKDAATVSTTDTYSETLVVPPGTTTYAGTVTYGQGACLDNNIGIEDCTGRIEAGTVNSAPRTVTGIYPVFYLKSGSPITASSMQAAINAGTASKLVISSTGTYTVPYAPNGEYYATAHPATNTTKTKWYVNALDNGNIPGGVFSTPTTLTVNSSSGFWSGVQYKIYTTPLLTNPTAPVIELRNI